MRGPSLMLSEARCQRSCRSTRGPPTPASRHSSRQNQVAKDSGSGIPAGFPFAPAAQPDTVRAMKQTQRFISPALLFSVLLAGLALAGCSSTPARVDKGPIQARTFSFIDRGAAPKPDFADSRDPVHRLVQ